MVIDVYSYEGYAGMGNDASIFEQQLLHVELSAYRIIPNKRTLCEGNGLEIHNLETELILPVFKAKLYHY